MKKIGIVFIALLAAIVLLPTIVSAQGATPAQVKALYSRWTQVDAWFAGYEKEGDICMAGTGFYMVKSDLVDGTIDALNPEALLMDLKGNIVGAQYRSTAATAPSLFGQAFTKSGSTFSLNVWFIPNTDGMYADRNVAVSCKIEEEGATTPGSGDITLPWGIIAVAGVGIVGIGVGVLRKGTATA
jgi:hypothetical protein